MAAKICVNTHKYDTQTTKKATNFEKREIQNNGFERRIQTGRRQIKVYATKRLFSWNL